MFLSFQSRIWHWTTTYAHQYLLVGVGLALWPSLLNEGKQNVNLRYISIFWESLRVQYVERHVNLISFIRWNWLLLFDMCDMSMISLTDFQVQHNSRCSERRKIIIIDKPPIHYGWWGLSDGWWLAIEARWSSWHGITKWVIGRQVY